MMRKSDREFHKDEAENKGLSEASGKNAPKGT